MNDQDIRYVNAETFAKMVADLALRVRVEPALPAGGTERLWVVPIRHSIIPALHYTAAKEPPSTATYSRMEYSAELIQWFGNPIKVWRQR